MSYFLVKPEGTQTWISILKSTLVIEIFKGEISPAEAARNYGLSAADIKRWKNVSGSNIPQHLKKQIRH